MVTASVLELGNDEVYYFQYAMDLQPNYFDHPPGVAWLIRIFTLNLVLTDEFFIRLGAIVCAAIGTVLSYELGKRIKNERTGWFAAILYTSSIYSSVIAGTFIIPDSPQIVFWLASLLVMHHILFAKEEQPVLTRSWLAFGTLTGLAILCKVHGIFLWVSMGLYILLFKPVLLKDRRLYLSAILTVVLISPILLWNIQNDFITYRFHSDRVAIRDSGIHLGYFFQTLVGQLLYNNPVNSVLIILTLWKLKTLDFLDRNAVWFLLLNGIPIIVIVCAMSLFNPMLPHWSGPGFLVLSFLTASYLDDKTPKSIDEPRILKASVGVVAALLLLAVAAIRFYPGTIGSKDMRSFGEGDFTLDLYGWKQFSKEFGPWLKEQEDKGKLSPDLSFVSNNWYPAAHIDYYVAIPLHRPLIGVSHVVYLHHYYWLNRQRPPLQIGDSALWILPSNYPMVLEKTFYWHFNSIEMLRIFYSYRGGKVARYFTVYLLKDYKMNDQAHQPPRKSNN